MGGHGGIELWVYGDVVIQGCGVGGQPTSSLYGDIGTEGHGDMDVGIWGHGGVGWGDMGA